MSLFPDLQTPTSPELYQAHEYRGQGDPSEDVLLYRVDTSAAAASAAAGKDSQSVPRLPSGTLVAGAPAAIISHCQASRSYVV